MEKCRNLTTCCIELLDDPALKTTAANYDFKYVPGDEFQRVIRTVQRDRLKQKKDSIWSEFCSSKSRHVVLENEIESKYERSHRKAKNVIKTKTSTIKIISHPMVEPGSDDQPSSTSREPYATYKVPKVRVMTDEEIKNVVELAFKEVMEQSGNSNIITQLQTDSNDKNDEPIEPLPQGYINERSTPRCDSTQVNQQASARSTKCIQAKKTLKTVSDEEPISLVSSRSIEPTEALASNRIVESLDEVDKLSVRTEYSIQSGKIPTSDCEKNIEENITAQENYQEKAAESEVHFEKSEVHEEKNISGIQIIPNLTCVEKDELRKFLGVQEFIINPEIDLNRFDTKSSSSSEEEQEKNHSDQNIHPLIHIRQPTPKSADSCKTGKLLGPINSSLEIPNLPPADFQPTAARKSLQTTPQRTLTPRKTPRTSITSRIGAGYSSPKTPRNIEKSPNKSTAKHSGANSSRVSLLLPSNVATPRSARKAKKLKSPESLSIDRYNELKHESVLLMAKIAGHHQKIIQIIGQIRLTLDDIPEPDGQLDFKRRERRAEEFISRFARNYLYQIGRLIEDLRIIPKEQVLAGTDNDISTKACSLFGILSQAILTYLKHMNSFIVDQNPKKLGTLIEAIIESVKMCVHKTLFDKKNELVLDLLRKAKGLKVYLAEAQEQVREARLPKQKLKSKSQKSIKEGVKVSKPSRKLSMYETLPAGLSTVKDKTHVLKATARPKTSLRSLVPRHSQPKAKLQKSERNASHKASLVKVQEKESLLSQQNQSTSRTIQSQFKDDVFPIKTPRIDQVNTLIETVGVDEFQDEPMPKTSDNSTKNILANVPEGQIVTATQYAEREKDINNTVIEALESITKQQVQQILGPLMSNLGAFVTNQASSASVDINAILNNLITSQLCNIACEIRSTDPLASGERTFNQKDYEFVSNELQNGTNSHSNTGHTYDNNANYERELTPQNQQRLDEPQSKTAPARNTFSDGELNNDEEVTSSQQPTFTPRSENSWYTEGYEDVTSDSETRARTKTVAEGYKPMNRDEGGDFGATKSEVETKKVQQLRFERNVQFTLVTDNEKGGDELHPNDNLIEEDGEFKDNSKTPSKNKYKKILEDEKNKRRVEKLCRERFHYIQQIAESPLYVNEYFTQPWKIVSKIANQIVNDAIDDVERSINFGEETFVRDFIQMELET